MQGMGESIHMAVIKPLQRKIWGKRY